MHIRDYVKLAALTALRRNPLCLLTQAWRGYADLLAQDCAAERICSERRLLEQITEEGSGRRATDAGALPPAALLRWPLSAGLDKPLRCARNWEWRRRSGCPNGSDMYLLFERP